MTSSEERAVKGKIGTKLIKELSGLVKRSMKQGKGGKDSKTQKRRND